MRRRSYTPLSCLLVMLSFTLASCGGGSTSAASSAKPVVLCTIFSYFDAARAIAGDKLDVQILLPPSASPHEYETSARDKKTANAAALYIKNGLGLDDHYDKLIDTSKTKVLTISEKIPKNELLMTQEVSLDEPAPPRAAPAQKKAEEEDESAGNPHIWLDPHIQMSAAEAIRDALIQLDPPDKATFRS